MKKKPSVSDLLDLLAKPALIAWANKKGLEGIDIKEKRKRSLAKGTSLHAEIERYCNGEAFFEDEKTQANFQRFIEGREIVEYEKDIETDWFVGRYDAKIKEGDSIILCDYKSGFKGKFYLEHKLQLIAYDMAEPADKLAIVAAPQFQLFDLQIENRKPYQEILKSLSHIWQMKREIENA